MSPPDLIAPVAQQAADQPAIGLELDDLVDELAAQLVILQPSRIVAHGVAIEFLDRVARALDIFEGDHAALR